MGLACKVDFETMGVEADGGTHHKHTNVSVFSKDLIFGIGQKLEKFGQLSQLERSDWLWQMERAYCLCETLTAKLIGYGS